MTGKRRDEQFSAEETQRRFEAALRGARIAGHKTKDSLTRKKLKPQRPRKAKT